LELVEQDQLLILLPLVMVLILFFQVLHLQEEDVVVIKLLAVFLMVHQAVQAAVVDFKAQAVQQVRQVKATQAVMAQTAEQMLVLAAVAEQPQSEQMQQQRKLVQVETAQLLQSQVLR
jgi:hypothetical protein